MCKSTRNPLIASSSRLARSLDSTLFSGISYYCACWVAHKLLTRFPKKKYTQNQKHREKMRRNSGEFIDLVARSCNGRKLHNFFFLLGKWEVKEKKCEKKTKRQKSSTYPMFCYFFCRLLFIHSTIFFCFSREFLYAHSRLSPGLCGVMCRRSMPPSASTFPTPRKAHTFSRENVVRFPFDDVEGRMNLN